MRVHFLQHVDYESIGSLAEWAVLHGHTVTGTKLYRKDVSFPSLDKVDLLVVMGGPMSVHDTACYPWLLKGKEYLAEALAKGIRILGICLGSQLLAEALGGQVVRNWQKEIGWHPIQWTQEARMHRLLSGFNERQFVFHWHGETFSLPENAIRLAGNEACPNQGFLWGNKGVHQVMGLQFHMEVGEQEINRFCFEGVQELTAGGQYVQSAGIIQSRARDICRPMQYWFWKLLDGWSVEAG